jgi:calreticulin
LQFQVRHPQKIDCGGGYIKLLPAGLDQEKFGGDSDYSIIFGPDVCGTSTKRVHVIFTHKGKNHLINKEIKCETDELSHVYTLWVKADGSYEVRIDGDRKESGKLSEDWDFLPAAKINDPDESKPSDWVDEAMIDDPEDVKPDGYDDIEKMIADPEAVKPDDWDDEDDGEWDAPLIDNPEYKGEWSAKRIANPDYVGKWEHPQIDNPEYDVAEIENLGKVADNAFVGFELWQVKAGSIFDNIIVTDSIDEAEDFMADTYGKEKDAEKASFDKAEEVKRAEEEAERKRLEAEAEDEDDADDDDDEEYDDDDDEGHDEL